MSHENITESVKTEKEDQMNLFQIVQSNLFAYFPKPNYIMFSYISPVPVFSHFECKTIVQFAKENKMEYQKINKNTIDLSEFNAKMTHFDYGQNADVDYFYEKIREMVVNINKELWSFDLCDYGEPLKFMEYTEGGFAIMHSDLSHINVSKYRKLTIVVQLSDENEYEGGDLVIQFYEKEQIMPKKIGTVIIFPSILMHRINPVTKGVRNTIVAFAYGPPFR